MARGQQRGGWWREPPWWAWLLIVAGAVFLAVGTPIAFADPEPPSFEAPPGAHETTPPATETTAPAPQPTGSVALSDDFERANSTTVGTAPTGQRWNESGSGGCAVFDGRVIAETPGGGNCYLSAEVDGTPTGMMVEASWTGEGALTGGITLITSTDPEWALENMVHFNLTPDGWVLQLRTDGGSFDSVLDGDLSLATDGTVHRWGMVIAEDTVTLLLPDGASQTYTSPRVAELNGPYVTVEPGSESGVVESRVDSVQVYAE